MVQKTRTFIKDGQTNEIYTLSNKNGCEVDVLTYGARILRIWMPDRKGRFGDCVVGCRRAEDYYGENPYFGATIGRYGNRIGDAKFTLNGTTYNLEANDNKNTLHGGITGDFSRKIWSAEIVKNCLLLSLVSPDGEGGFPGTLEVTLCIELTDNNEIILDYRAKSDKDTVCNLTNHTYFNIGDQPTVLHHELMLKAEKMTPVDNELIPHGEYMDINGTPYSFMPAKTLGKDMFSDAPMIKQCNGYDFNYCLDRIGKGLEHFGYVYDPETGRKMDCYTTLPGVQLYTACSTGGFKGKKRQPYVNHCALCLETQGFPNSPNCPQYPSTILKAGEEYREITMYKFSVVHAW
ncbi:MAG: galactose mutarotase [Clostridia bacterium]|nr:galactose mutarotase [Clostridia bacterium]